VDAGPKPLESLLQQLADQVTSHENTVARFGARLVVQRKFIDAVLPALNLEKCQDVRRHFKQHVEDALARTDDVPMPREYLATFLSETNALLAILDMIGSRSG
jgi:hypothetical protein